MLRTMKCRECKMRGEEYKADSALIHLRGELDRLVEDFAKNFLDFNILLNNRGPAAAATVNIGGICSPKRFDFPDTSAVLRIRRRRVRGRKEQGYECYESGAKEL